MEMDSPFLGDIGQPVQGSILPVSVVPATPTSAKGRIFCRCSCFSFASRASGRIRL
ncbi:hypothetical protein [Marinobacterium aestuariivivens]|uniref:Uncharacterized protein n=1 Tax=Marinobacterium aestuariivivens TaxID=1698799 RepID=A0ABW2A793_9GAMM